MPTMTGANGAIALAIVGGVIAIAKLWLQHRANLELKAAEAETREELAKEQAAAAERAARHAREAAEREAEREQKEKLIAELQGANKRTLDFLEGQLKAQQESSSKRYDIIERNTSANEKIATALAAQAQELRVMVERVSRIEGGAGCRAVSGIPGGRSS